MPSLRTQIYLTREQRKRLTARGKRERKSLAALIREAIDVYLGTHDRAAVQTVMDETFGIDPNFTVPSREEWDERARRLGI